MFTGFEFLRRKKQGPPPRVRHYIKDPEDVAKLAELIDRKNKEWDGRGTIPYRAHTAVWNLIAKLVPEAQEGQWRYGVDGRYIFIEKEDK